MTLAEPTPEDVAAAERELAAALAALKAAQAPDSGIQPAGSFTAWIAADCRYRDAQARLAGLRRRLARRREMAARGRR